MVTLRHAMIFAKDMTRMTAFYRDALGLTVVPDKASAEWVELDAGGARVALHLIPEKYAKDIQITTPPKARSENPIKIAFTVDDLATARERLVAHGAVMFDPHAFGCDGLDPEGNVFQIVGR